MTEDGFGEKYGGLGGKIVLWGGGGCGGLMGDGFGGKYGGFGESWMVLGK